MDNNRPDSLVRIQAWLEATVWPVSAGIVIFGIQVIRGIFFLILIGASSDHKYIIIVSLLCLLSLHLSRITNKIDLLAIKGQTTGLLISISDLVLRLMLIMVILRQVI